MKGLSVRVEALARLDERVTAVEKRMTWRTGDGSTAVSLTIDDRPNLNETRPADAAQLRNRNC